jgi:transposase
MNPIGMSSSGAPHNASTKPPLPSIDTLAVHKQPEVRAAIEAVGAAIRFLPPYSPDFNPIEQAFAKLKAFLRAARPRTFDQVLALVAAALDLFTPAECRNYIRHSGYRLTVPL